MELPDPADKIVSFRFLNEWFQPEEGSAVRLEMGRLLLKKRNATIRGFILKIHSCFWIWEDPE